MQAGLLDPEGVGAVRAALDGGKSLDDALREAKGASEEKVLRFLGDYFAVPFVDLEKDAATYAPPKELLAKFPARILLDRRLMPLTMNGNANGNGDGNGDVNGDRKSTRLNSSHSSISYAVFCLKKKNQLVDDRLIK